MGTTDRKNICVVIPVHAATLTATEVISIKRCREILGSYDVYLVFPTGMNINIYQHYFPELRLQPVDRKWLSNIDEYNKMKRSLSFYNLFRQYQFMLTYELDAYIFSDAWNRANALHYDFIGAPWFNGYKDNSPKTHIIGTGNSGFSLRNIERCIMILKKRERVKKAWTRLKQLKLDRVIPLTFLLRLMDAEWKLIRTNYYFIPFVDKEYLHEDIFWCETVPKLLKFKIASVEDSLKFSFELQPSVLYKMNKHRLPLGCHAWFKYSPEFWKPFINETEYNHHKL